MLESSYKDLTSAGKLDVVDARKFGSWMKAFAMNLRMIRDDELWPWRKIIASGEAREYYLRGIIIENYHYVRAAMMRQVTSLQSDMPPNVYDLIRDYIRSEAMHDELFIECLTRWGLPIDELRRTQPLTGTRLFIDSRRSLGLAGPLHYLSGTTITEIHPEVYSRMGSPYDTWITNYGISEEILRPINRHIKDDIESNHGSLFERVINEYDEIPLNVASSLVQATKYTFEALRIWQRDMYEFYQLQNNDFNFAI